MNEDGSLGIPHGAPSEEEMPSEAPIASNVAEELLNNSANTSTENQLDISHDTPIENQTVPVNSEPIDIFAQQGAIAPNDMAPESNISEDASMSFNTTSQTTTNPTAQTHLSNNPFSNRNHYQHSSQKTNPDIPQFFSNAIATNATVQAPRKSRKGLFIGIGIGAIVICIIIITILLLKNTVTHDDNGSIASRLKDNTKQLFYSYGNYLLFGIDSNDKIDMNNLSTAEYSYLYKINSGAGIYDQNYANTLSEKFTAFADKAKKDYNNEESQMIGIINEYSELLNFIKSNPTRDELSLDALYKEYLTNGKAGAEQRASTQLKPYNTDNESIQMFYDAKLNSYNSFILYLESLKANGCIVNNEINTTCEAKIKYSGPNKDANPANYNQYSIDADNLLDTEIHNLASDYLSMLNIIDEEGVTKE